MAGLSPIISSLIRTSSLLLPDMLARKGCVYTFLNPVSYLDALDNAGLYSQFDGIFADGSLLVKSVDKIYKTKIKRYSFDQTSLAPIVFDYANSHSLKVCVIASREDELGLSISKLRSRYPNIDWTGSRNGYFADDTEMSETIGKIISIAPDFLIVGMGAIKQEKFLLECKACGFNGIGFTCGGFIHQLSKGDDNMYYPNWVNRCNLRFLYRFVKEKHTRKRYIVTLFVFPVRFLKERNSYKRSQ